MARAFWNGRGELRDGEVAFMNTRGEYKGRPYVREYARRKLARWSSSFTPAERNRILAETVDCDAWLATRNGMLPSAIARDVEDALFAGGAR